MSDIPIKFNVNAAKLLAASLYILGKKKETSVFDLMEFLYKSEAHHLNKNGRPITGARYSITSGEYYIVLNLLDFLNLHNFIKFDRTNEIIESTSKADLKHLSQSDLDALNNAIKLQGNYPSPKILKYDKTYPVAFEDMISEDNLNLLTFLKNNPQVKV